MATVLLLRCQVSPHDLAAATCALERAGLDVVDTAAHPEGVITVGRRVGARSVLLRAWADALDAADAQLRAAGVSARLQLAGVRSAAVSF